jgi:S-adenosylmethionine synthetase
VVEIPGITGSRSLEISHALREEFDLTPAGIIARLDLQRPIYYPTAAYGHFGRDDLDLPWERLAVRGAHQGAQ